MVKFSLNDGWYEGPLPPNTWNWGGVVLHEDLKDSDNGKPQWFRFANFCGDHVTFPMDDKTEKDEDGKKVDKKYQAHEVAYYNNCLCLPTGPSKCFTLP